VRINLIAGDVSREDRDRIHANLGKIWPEPAR
jgi:hypothetical protein